MTRATLPLLLGILLLQPAPAQGQEEVESILSGQLLRAGVPQDSGTVVLHRVTPEEAGDIDSVSVREDGTFDFRLPHLPIPGSGEIFFASTRYEGIVYFGGPLNAPALLDSLYLIEVFPSEPAPPQGYAFPISIREVWIEEGPLGWRVTDAFIVHNSAQSTFVAADAEGAVWRYPLPAEAEALRIVEMGPVQGPIRFAGNILVAANPVVPGRNFVMIQYDLESLEFDLELPGEIELVRIFMREPVPAVRVEGLARLPTEEIEIGTSYQQWAGQGVRDQLVRVRLGEESDASSVAWLSVGLALLLVATGIWAVKRSPAGWPARPPPAPPGDARPGGGPGTRRRKEVLVEVARLDEEFGRLKHPDAGDLQRHQRRRDALLRELDEAGGGGSRDR